MYDASQANFDVVADYVEAMTKCCWGYVENKTEAVSAIADGAYGIVSSDESVLSDAISYFSKSGYAKAQNLAAHRGITAYANENSLTAIASSINEGATHVEIDLQITADGQIVICHDSETNATSVSGTYFERATLAALNRFKLSDYSEKYGDTYPTLEEVISLAKNNDLIFIFELKFGGATTNIVDNLKPIDKLKEILDQHPEMQGRWYAITFYAPFAERMQELMPEIPVGYLGGATSGKESDQGLTGWNGGHVGMTKISDKIAFLRKYHLGLDEVYYESATNSTAQTYLARGYTQNTWTFDNVSHFTVKADVATSNAVEKAAMFAKELGVGTLNLTKDDLANGTATVACRTYNGWLVDLPCEIIVVDQTESGASVLLYYKQEWSYTQTLTNQDPVTVNGYNGLYSKLINITF
jgi:glycerophosphoryl diester phosphodiesterase